MSGALKLSGSVYTDNNKSMEIFVLTRIKSNKQLGKKKYVTVLPGCEISFASKINQNKLGLT